MDSMANISNNLENKGIGMRPEREVPVDAEVTVQSIRWVIQSRWDKGDPWRTEHDTTPGLPGAFEGEARRLLKVYRIKNAGKEHRLARRTEACHDEPMED